MLISEYIDKGKKKAGTIEALGEVIGVRGYNLSSAKTGKRPLQEEACVKLANYIGEPWHKVYQAMKVAAAKDEEQRKLWKNAACVLITVGMGSGILTPQEAHAAVNSYLNVTAGGQWWSGFAARGMLR